MGNRCCKVKCENHEEQKSLLENTSKSVEELDSEQACSKEEYGGQADSSGIQDCREFGGEAQMTVVPEIQVNLEVGSDLGTAENKYPEESSSTTEDGCTMDHSQKINGRNLEDEKTGSGHIVCSVRKVETCSIHVEDLSKLENPQDKPIIKKAESELLPSSNSENVQRKGLSLKSKSVEVTNPSLESDLEGDVDPSLNSEPIKVEYPSLKDEPTELEDPFLKRETAELKDPSLNNEHIAVVQTNPNNEPVLAVGPFLKNKPLEAVGPFLKIEPVEAVGPFLRNEPLEPLGAFVNIEPIEDVGPCLRNELVETVDPFVSNKPLETVDPFIKNAAVEPFINNEPKEVGDSSLNKQIMEVIEPPIESQSVQSEVCLPGPQDMKTEDPTPKAVDGAKLGPGTVFLDEASPLTDHEPCLGNLSSCPMEEDEPEDPKAKVLALHKVPSLEGIVQYVEEELEPEVKEDEGIRRETCERDEEGDASEMTEASGKSEMMEGHGATEAREENSNLGSPLMVQLETEPLSSQHGIAGVKEARPADQEAAVLVSDTLNLERESEHKECHASESDVLATVEETSDVNDDNSSSQAEKPSIMDELITSKSCPMEEEEPEDPKAKVLALHKVPSLEGIVQYVEEELEPEVKEDEGIRRETCERDEEGDASEMTEASGKSEMMEGHGATEAREENSNLGSPLMVQLKTEPLSSQHGIAGVKEASFDDLYRAEEDIIKDKSEHGKMEPLIPITFTGAQDRSSVAPGVDILSYSEREWKGHTAKSALIRKGYSELSQSFEGLRRVRGDNYCALRATLFQVLTHSDKLPAWIDDDDITLLPEKLAVEMEPVENWKFPIGFNEPGEKEDTVKQLKCHLKLLQETWRAAVEAGGAEERRALCEAVFQGGEEELALLEAVKLLMLSSAVELHANMARGEEVPVFCWLLFARDGSECPRTFLTNYLSHVGFTGGLEQVEMFLLGYTLQQTIQVYRLYKTDTEEFITYYPDDHKEDWPMVPLVTEDDRHYNVLV